MTLLYERRRRPSFETRRGGAIVRSMRYLFGLDVVRCNCVKVLTTLTSGSAVICTFGMFSGKGVERKAETLDPASQRFSVCVIMVQGMMVGGVFVAAEAHTPLRSRRGPRGHSVVKWFVTISCLSVTLYAPPPDVNGAGSLLRLSLRVPAFRNWRSV